MKFRQILCALPLLLSACATAPISDGRATAEIVRQICPNVQKISKTDQQKMAAMISVCIDPRANLDIFSRDLCGSYINILSQYKVARDQARVCYAQ